MTMIGAKAAKPKSPSFHSVCPRWLRQRLLRSRLVNSTGNWPANFARRFDWLLAPRQRRSAPSLGRIASGHHTQTNKKIRCETLAQIEPWKSEIESGGVTKVSQRHHAGIEKQDGLLAEAYRRTKSFSGGEHNSGFDPEQQDGEKDKGVGNGDLTAAPGILIVICDPTIRVMRARAANFGPN